MQTTVDSADASRYDDLKTSVASKMDELRSRLSGVNREMIEAKIVAHPWPAVGGALALGVLVALGGHRPKAPEQEVKRTMGGAVVAAVGAVAIRMLKSYAISQLGDAAKNWLGANDAKVSSTERAASNDPATSSFLEH
ncbi:MAG: hypothetical protein H0T46_30765 [Deltaproteobacteria bacterium]|nr:hypothetical protein [Deltaproteobacteria bacterium]